MKSLALVLLLAVPCQAQESVRVVRYAVAGAQMTDLSSSIYAFSQGHREGNPALAWAQDKPVWFAVTKATGYIVTDLALAHLAKRHKKAAVIVGWCVVGFYAGITARNMQIARTK